MEEKRFKAMLHVNTVINHLISISDISQTYLTHEQVKDIFSQLKTAVQQLDEKFLNKKLNQTYLDMMKMTSAEIIETLSEINDYILVYETNQSNHKAK